MQVGSIINLKSGGPDMTVTNVNGTDVTARWYLEGQGFREETFHADTIDEKGAAKGSKAKG